MSTSATSLVRILVLSVSAGIAAAPAIAQCTDVDTDGFFYEAGCGTAQDCNDAAPTTYPGTPEVCDDLNGELQGLAFQIKSASISCSD